MRSIVCFCAVIFTSGIVAAEKTLELPKHLRLLKSVSNYRSLGDVLHKSYLKNALKNYVKETRPNRVSGSEGHKKSQTYITAEFKRLGERVVPARAAVVEEFTPDTQWAQKKYLDDFQKEVAKRFTPLDPVYIKWRRFTDDIVARLSQISKSSGRNIIFELPGKKNPQDVLIVGANDDTIIHNSDFKLAFDGAMPAANDNGTGVVGVLAMAEILAQLELDRTIIFVIFDHQELGSLGAREFIARHNHRLKCERCGMINLLMLGHDSIRDDKLKRHGNMKVYTRSNAQAGGQKDNALLGYFKYANNYTSQAALFSPMDNGPEISDQGAFWQADLPALLFTQDWENDPDPRQHTANDFPETINFDTYGRSLRYILAGIIHWSQSP